MEKITYYLNRQVPFLPVLIYGIVAIVGLWNLTREEGISFRTYVQHQEFTDSKIKPLWQDVNVSGEFIASEPQLGSLSFRFQKPDRESKSAVIFRIKEKGKSSWHYEHTYTANQLHVYDWYPFGFPIIERSRGKTYTFELIGVSLVKEDAVLLLANRGFAVQYILPNERLLSPINRILMLFQQNVAETIKVNLLIYSGYVTLLFIVYFFAKEIPITVKKFIIIVIFVYVYYWQFDPYRSIQFSTICILLDTVYFGVAIRLLNGTKTLILSNLLFTIMSVYFVLGKVAIAERIAEWVYVLMIIALINIVFELNINPTKNHKLRYNK